MLQYWLQSRSYALYFGRHLALQEKIKVGYLKINGDDKDDSYFRGSFSWKSNVIVGEVQTTWKL